VGSGRARLAGRARRTTRRALDDATYAKVCQNGRIVSVAVIIAAAVNGDGRREELDMEIGASEAETFCTAFRVSLRVAACVG
jgi:putative transposase